MKATIKRIQKLNGDACFKVFKEGDSFTVDVFWFRNEQEEKSAFELALKVAKKIEAGVEEEKIVYETPTDPADQSGIEPIDYFLAANMTEDELSNHLKNIMK